MAEWKYDRNRWEAFGSRLMSFLTVLSPEEYWQVYGTHSCWWCWLILMVNYLNCKRVGQTVIRVAAIDVVMQRCLECASVCPCTILKNAQAFEFNTPNLPKVMYCAAKVHRPHATHIIFTRTIFRLSVSLSLSQPRSLPVIKSARRNVLCFCDIMQILRQCEHVFLSASFPFLVLLNSPLAVLLVLTNTFFFAALLYAVCKLRCPTQIFIQKLDNLFCCSIFPSLCCRR